MSGMGIVEALRIARDPIRYEAEEVIAALAGPCHQAELLGNPRVEMTVRWDG